MLAHTFVAHVANTSEMNEMYGELCMFLQAKITEQRSFGKALDSALRLPDPVYHDTHTFDMFFTRAVLHIGVSFPRIRICLVCVSRRLHRHVCCASTMVYNILHTVSIVYMHAYNGYGGISFNWRC